MTHGQKTLSFIWQNIPWFCKNSTELVLSSCLLNMSALKNVPGRAKTTVKKGGLFMELSTIS